MLPTVEPPPPFLRLVSTLPEGWRRRVVQDAGRRSTQRASNGGTNGRKRLDNGDYEIFVRHPNGREVLSVIRNEATKDAGEEGGDATRMRGPIGAEAETGAGVVGAGAVEKKKETAAKARPQLHAVETFKLRRDRRTGRFLGRDLVKRRQLSAVEVTAEFPGVVPAPLSPDIPLFVAYEAPTSGYFMVASSGCFGGWNHSLVNGVCLEPLLHDAAYGRGYGRQADARARPPMSFDDMRSRRPEQLPKSHIAQVQGGHTVVESHADHGGHYSVTLRLKAPVAADAAAILKVNYHPFWRCRVDGEDVTVGIAHVAPGFMAIPLPDQAGTVRVACSYTPPVWKKLLFWAGLGCSAVAWAAVVMAWVRRG